MDCSTSRRKLGSELVFLRRISSMVAKLRSPRACSHLFTQEKAEQDEELPLVHEDKEDLAAELQVLERTKRS